MAGIAQTTAAWTPRVQSILRIAARLLVMEHGTTKLLHFPPTDYSGIPISTMPGAAGIFELICGELVVIGLFTRPAAFLLSGMCAVGYWTVHAPGGLYPMLNGGETIAMYCF